MGFILGDLTCYARGKLSRGVTSTPPSIMSNRVFAFEILSFSFWFSAPKSAEQSVQRAVQMI